MNSDQIIQRLKEGNNRFVADKLNKALQDGQRRRQLIEKQEPWAVILSCADSRVVPELIFDGGLGELFTVRVAGNVANSSSIASIEYAVANLGASVVVVMGHQHCGAVTAAVKGGDYGHNLNHLLAHITPSVTAAPDKSSVDKVIIKNAELNAQSLAAQSSIIKKAADEGKVKITPAYYSLESGRVDFL